MLYLRHTPGPPLSEFADYFWQVEGGQTPRKERILPSGTVELVVNLRDDEIRIHDPAHPGRYKRFAGAVTSGTYSGLFVCDAMQHECLAGVHFKPGGAFPFLNTPAGELADQHTDLADLWGRAAVELRERLCAAETAGRRFQVLEEVLLERLRRWSVKRHPALPVALRLFGRVGTGASVRDAAREVGLCQRRLIEVFTAEVGLTPKQFCRILRFQRARTLAEPGTSAVDWAQLAVTCGYFDQSHFIHDFREFSGLRPSDFVQQTRGAGLLSNHVTLPETVNFFQYGAPLSPEQ